MVFDQQVEPMVRGLDCVNVFRNSDDIWPKDGAGAAPRQQREIQMQGSCTDSALYKLTALRPVAISGDSLGEVWPRTERIGLRAPAMLHMPWFSALTFLSAASDLVTAAAKFQVLSRSQGRQNSRQAELPRLAVCRGVQRTPKHRPKQFGGWMHLDHTVVNVPRCVLFI